MHIIFTYDVRRPSRVARRLCVGVSADRMYMSQAACIRTNWTQFRCILQVVRQYNMMNILDACMHACMLTLIY